MRHPVVAILAGAFALLVPISGAAPAAGLPPAYLHKDPNCVCCEGYIAYLREQGLTVTVRDVDDVTPTKRFLGVPEGLWSCHTMRIGRYVIEGHVPLAAIERLLTERPNVRGVALPGMLAGSPGMEGAKEEPFLIQAFGGQGSFVYMKL
ncbi:MAG: hypothetical protein HY521_14820 [Proteobacteria bacterium]|nr:hypothetical protein [Pseudomonadota bacterium]